MRSNWSPPEMIGIRVLLMAVAGVASIGGVQLAAMLELAALDGGQELPSFVAYGVLTGSSIFLPTMLAAWLNPRRWRGITVGLGSGVGTTFVIATAAQRGELISMAWLFGLTALAAGVGTFAWMPGMGVVRSGGYR